MTSRSQGALQSMNVDSTEILFAADGEGHLSSHHATNSHLQVLVSERVQALASTIYREFEAIIRRYDEEAVKKLMPVVVTALEQLDLAFSSQAELQAELEILRDDNSQLLSQYEREKAERKNVAARCNEVEDAKEDEIKQLRSKLDSLESIVRLMDARLKTANDQSTRTEERCEEMKREYTKLHDRYTELFRSHVDYVDRTKSLFGIDRADSQSAIDRARRSVMQSATYRDVQATSTHAVLNPVNNRLSADLSDMNAHNPAESNRNSVDLNSELNSNAAYAPTGSDTTSVQLQPSVEHSSTMMSNANMSFVGGELDMETEVLRIEPSSERDLQSTTAQSDELQLHVSSLNERSAVQSTSTALRTESENHLAALGGGSEPDRRVGRYSSRSLPRGTATLSSRKRVPTLLERAEEESLSTSFSLRKSKSITALNKDTLKNFYSLTSTDDLLGASERADSELERSSEMAASSSEGAPAQLEPPSGTQFQRPVSMESDSDTNVNLNASLNAESGKSSLFQEIAPTGVLSEIDMGADLSGPYQYKQSSTLSYMSRLHSLMSSSDVWRSGAMASADADLMLLSDVEPDYTGMRKVTDHLIKENIELLEKKNALNVLKDDLLAQIEEANSERMLLKAEIESLNTVKSRTTLRISELEEEVRRLREELAEEKRRHADAANPSSTISGDEPHLDDDADTEAERNLPYAQRRRFTRLEMARVLTERNMYKERLYELQESIRYAEMMRAARQHPDVLPMVTRGSQQPMLAKKKSSIWNLFSGLFASGSQQNVKGKTTVAPVSTSTPIWFTSVSSTAPTSGSSTPHRRSDVFEASQRSLNASVSASVSSRRFFLENVVQTQMGTNPRRRAHYEERCAAYRRIREYLQMNESQLMTAYGWSLPAKMQTRLDAEGKSALAEIPVPVYVRPLDTKGGMKIWCAAAVNLNGFDQVASPFGDEDSGSSTEHPQSASENDTPTNTAGNTATNSSTGMAGEDRTALVRFEREIDRALEDLRASEKEREALTSIVWVSATLDAMSSQVIIVDANNRGEIMARFTVSAEQLTAICSVPGHRSATDYASRPANLLKATELHPSKSASPDPDATSQRRKQESAASPSKMVSNDPSSSRRRSHVKRNEDNDSLESFDEDDTNLDANAQAEPLGVVPITEIDSLLQHSDSESASLEELTAANIPTRLPTVWLGSVSGWIYVHSAVANWRRCLAAVRLPDAVLAIAHANGRIFAALADGRVVVFFRDARTREWDVTRYALVTFNRRRPVRCLQVIAGGNVWCTVGNRVFVLDAESLEQVRAFDAHPRHDAHVRHMAWCGDGVWLALKLESTLRLFHAFTYDHLQDIDIQPVLARVLGPTAFQFVRVTALMIACNRLWVGTADGVTLTLPFVSTDRKAAKANSNMQASSSISDQMHTSLNPGGLMRVLYEDAETQRIQPGTSFVPYAISQLASLSFHGHRDAVRFFICAPTRTSAIRQRRVSTLVPVSADSPSRASDSAKAERGATTDGWLVVSGGEGYLDLRHSDPETDSSESGTIDTSTDANVEAENERWRQRVLASKQERSHLIAWQLIVA